VHKVTYRGTKSNYVVFLKKIFTHFSWVDIVFFFLTGITE